MYIENGDLIYLYDGTFDGLLTSVFESYSNKEVPYKIAFEENFQQSFNNKIKIIKTDLIKSKRVADGFSKKAGKQAFDNIVTSFLSNDFEKENKIFMYIKTGLSKGPSFINQIALDEVFNIDKLVQKVGREAHLLTGFVRFKLMEGGVFYSLIEPTHNIIPIIMPFFADRYADQPFIIHDPGHKIAGFYDMKQWKLVETSELKLPKEHEEQANYERMWKKFYNTIAIEGRYNPICQRNHMPKKYWKHLTEMKFTNDMKTKLIE